MAGLQPVTLGLEFEMDVWSMVSDTVTTARAAAGQAPLAPEQQDAVVKEALAHMGDGVVQEAAQLRQRLNDLGSDGVEVVTFTHAQQGRTASSMTHLALADLALLPHVRIPGSQAQNAVLTPLAGFKVTRKPGTVELSGTMPRVQAVQARQGMARLWLECGAAIKKHNATRTQGNRLIWEADVGAAPVGVSVVFARG